MNWEGWGERMRGGAKRQVHPQAILWQKDFISFSLLVNPSKRYMGDVLAYLLRIWKA